MSRSRQPSWAEVLNLRQAASTAKTEMYGDWVRDPWEWPELEYLAQHPEFVVARLEVGRTSFERTSVPKVAYGTRPAVIQSPVDRIAFHALVNCISGRISTDLQPFVHGWRLARQSPEAGHYNHNGDEHRSFRALRADASETYPAVLVTDITNFFGSIQTEQLMDIIRTTAGNNMAVDAIEAVVEVFNSIPNRRGIPQRSTASAVLANICLRTIDDILARFERKYPGSILRWMDDIYAFGPSYEALRLLQLDIQDELRNVGLEINLGKTRILEGDKARSYISNLDFETSTEKRIDLDEAANTQESATGTEGALNQSDFDQGKKDLARQFERLVEQPEQASRSLIGFVCKRIRTYERTDYLPRLVDIANRMPQGADHLSRAFGELEGWRNLDEWYVDLATSAVGYQRLPWPVAQLGTMFPSDRPHDKVADLFATSLNEAGSSQVEMVAVAAHRLSSWRPDDARSILRRLGDESASPLCRRIAAIALHNLGEQRRRVKSILGEFEENHSTREYLANLGAGRKVPESRDFDPANNQNAF